MKVVKDFCFPNGVQITKLDFKFDQTQQDPEVEEKLMKFFFHNKTWRESTFLFTLDANEDKGSTGDNYLNCMCCIFNDLMSKSSDGSLYLVEKAFCFMFSNNYFSLHLEVLTGI